MSHHYEEGTEDWREEYSNLQFTHAKLREQYLELQERFGKLMEERNALRFCLDAALDRLQGIV